MMGGWMIAMSENELGITYVSDPEELRWINDI